MWAGNLKNHRQQREHSLLLSSARASCPSSTTPNQSKNDPRWPPGKMEVPLCTCCTSGSNATELLDKVNAQIRCLRRTVVWRMFPFPSCTAPSTQWSQHMFSPDSGLYLGFHWRCGCGSEVWTVGVPSFGSTFPAVLLEIPVKALSHQVPASNCWKWRQHWAPPWSVETSHGSH